MAGVHQPQRDQSEHQQRHHFQHGGQQLQAASLAHAEQIDPGAGPQRHQATGRRPHRGSGQSRKNRADAAGKRHCDGGDGAPHGDPVAPGHHEAGQLAEGIAGEYIGAAGLWPALGQLREGDRQQQRAAQGDAPANQGGGAIRGEGGGQQEGARADHAAHNQGGSGPEAQGAARSSHRYGWIRQMPGRAQRRRSSMNKRRAGAGRLRLGADYDRLRARPRCWLRRE